MATTETACNLLHRSKPFLLMLTVQIIFMGLNILSKLAAQHGMRIRTMVAYRFPFSAAFMVPVAFVMERHKRPSLTWTVIFQAFLGGLFSGSLGQNLYLESLGLTSASCAAAMFDLIPAITFLVAVCLRLEILGWKTRAGKAKVIGTIISVGGAMIFAFYRGPEIIPWRTNINLLRSVNHHATHTGEKNLILGIILGLLRCVSHSFWFIIQAEAAASYPCPHSFTALVVLMASIQSVVFGMCIERDWSEWKLGWNIRLLTVSYAGILGSGLMFVFIAICVSMRGPLFGTNFSPLLLILVAIWGSIFLDEKLHLGNFVGGLLIIFGLYAVLWGKSKEVKEEPNQLIPQYNTSYQHDDGVHQEPVEQMEITIQLNKQRSPSKKKMMEQLATTGDHQEQVKQLTAVGDHQQVEQIEITIRVENHIQQ